MPGPEPADVIAELEAAVEGGVAVPLVMFGGTDGRYLADIGDRKSVV